jgi:RNA polymerase sigma-70 factor (ECF subfamily)
MSTSLATFEDSTLIKLTLAGQAECFTVLIDRHWVAVRKRIYSMVRNATDADDVLQEVLLKVWRHLSTFRSESSFRTWMISVATNEAMQLYRRERSRAVCQPLRDLDAFASPVESQHQTLARVEIARAVRSAIVGLPAKYREVLILCDLDQLTAREAAQWLQSSVPAVKTRLFRARLMLLAELQRSRTRGLESHGRRKLGSHPKWIPGITGRSHGQYRDLTFSRTSENAR